MILTKNHKILIVGLGLIGGSYAMGLSQKGYEVGAISLHQEDIDYAIENNIIMHGKVSVDKEYVSSFDVIIFALYPKILLEWINKYYSYFKKGAIITDVTGIKKEVAYKIQEMLIDNEYIGAHPMAGKEVYGIRNADNNIFKKANYIVTPTSSNTNKAIQLACDIGKELEFSNISILTPEKHDEMIAFLSQLTHCIAVSLMTCKDSEHLKDYTGDSFRDLTRIAAINEDMWSELFLLNKQDLLNEMESFSNEFNKLKDAINNEDVKTIKEMMRLSTKRRNYFNK